MQQGLLDQPAAKRNGPSVQEFTDDDPMCSQRPPSFSGRRSGPGSDAVGMDVPDLGVFHRLGDGLEDDEDRNMHLEPEEG